MIKIFKLFFFFFCLFLAFISGKHFRNDNDMVQKSNENELPQYLIDEINYAHHPNSVHKYLTEAIVKYLIKNNIYFTGISFHEGGLIGLGLSESSITNLHLVNGLPLYDLGLEQTPVINLEPLQGSITLRSLGLRGSLVVDLEPIDHLPIKDIDISNTAITNILPLQNMPLEILMMDNVKIQDFSIITNIPLRVLSFKNVTITNLNVLANMQDLEIHLTPQLYTEEEFEKLKTYPLKSINDIPRELWDVYDLYRRKTW